jgi:alcohol dehydrogenase
VKFELLLPGATHFGQGEIARIGALAATLGRRALLVTGWGSLEGSGRFNGILRNLDSHGITIERFRLEREPGLGEVAATSTMARSIKAEMVIAVGGGSAIDLAKAAAAMARNGGIVKDYLEGVGKGAVMEQAPLPIIAVPTTAGTGSEATRNAVIGSAKDGFKKSLRDNRLLPRIALVDPELTVSCPPEVTAATGMDALTQLIEALTSRNSSEPISALALSGISAAAKGLPRAVAKGEDLDARGLMSYASYLSGVALSHAGLGAVHALASPLGGLFGVPHTKACAILLPPVTAANILALEQARGSRNGLDAYRRVEAAMGETIAEFCGRFKFPRLGDFGIQHTDLDKIASGAGAGNLKTNPVDLAHQELVELLRSVL